jgi:hypothetical protein
MNMIPFVTKKNVLWLILIFLSLQASAQSYTGLRFNLGIEKRVELNKKHQLLFGQQLQVTPDLSKLQPFRLRRDRDFGEIDFIDDLFLPRGEGYDDGDDDGDEDDDGIGDDDDNDNDNDGVDDDEDDDDDDPLVGGSPGGGSTALPPNQPERATDRRGDNLLAFRSATSIGWEWELADKLVLANEYTLNIRPGQPFTHFFVTELGYQIDIVPKVLALEPFSRLHNEIGQTRKGTEIVTHARGGTQARLKLGKKVSTFVSGEAFYRLKRGESKFNRLRASIGFDYKISKVQRMRVSYDYQQRINVTRPEQAGVLVVGYRLVF